MSIFIPDSNQLKFVRSRGGGGALSPYLLLLEPFNVLGGDRQPYVEYLKACSFFPQLLAAILNFCIKCKNVFISEIERDRAILTKFLIGRVSAESTGEFPQKSFSRHFWRPS